MITRAQTQRVAFQGERGAFSEEAAIRLLGEDVQLVPCRTFADLFQSIPNAKADLIVAPVENSISGIVEPSMQLMNLSGLEKVEELSLPIKQNLIALPGAQFCDLRTVQSHPVALAQCKRFFALHPELKQIVADDTAGSVAEIVRRGDSSSAAIAGTLAAKTYGAVILEEGIQDTLDNFTRFVLLAPVEATKTA